MLTIYGLFTHAGMPAIQLLEMDRHAAEPESHIEIARSHWHHGTQTGHVYDAIIIVIGPDQCRVFTFT